MPRPRQAAVPRHVRAALEYILAAPIAQVAVIEHSRLARLHGRAVATTRRRRIYLRGSAADFFANPWLMLHEYCHVLRQWEPGTLTLARYLLECARHGYWNNVFEVEARAFADRHLSALHAALKDGGAPSAEQRLAPVESSCDRHQQRARTERGAAGERDET
jgi:hypothetical protein